jgi:hypothetical protein
MTINWIQHALQRDVHVSPPVQRTHDLERIHLLEEFMIQRSLPTCITFANRDDSDTGPFAE